MSFLKFDPTRLPEPEIGTPDAAKLLAGSPKFKTWVLDSPNEKTFTGYWSSTPGKWRVHYDEWEYCTMVDGVSIITEDGKDSITLKAGDHIVLRPGFTGTWEVVEATTKTFVVILP